MQGTKKLEPVILRHSAVGSVVLGLLVVGAGAASSGGSFLDVSRDAAKPAARPARLAQHETATSVLALVLPDVGPAVQGPAIQSKAPPLTEAVAPASLAIAAAPAPVPAASPRAIAARHTAAAFAAQMHIFQVPLSAAAEIKADPAPAPIASDSIPAAPAPQAVASVQLALASAQPPSGATISAKPLESAAPVSASTPDAAPLVAAPASAASTKVGIDQGLNSPAAVGAAASPPAPAAPSPQAAQSSAPAALASTSALQTPPGIGAVKFDLATLPRAPRPARSHLAVRPSQPAAAGARSRLGAAHRGPAAKIGAAVRNFAQPPLNSRYKLTARGLEFAIDASVNGAVSGKVPLLLDSADHLSVRLSDVLALVRPLMDQASFDRLSASRSAQEYVSFETLRNAGIDVRYDAGHDQLSLSAEGSGR